MKTKITSLITILILSLNSSNAQLEFPISDARWCYYGYGDTGENLGNFCFSPDGMVEVNGKTYTKIDIKDHPYDGGSKKYLYREENKKFYVIPENYPEEILIYDFNLIEGDTFVAHYAWGVFDSLTLVVESVDSITTLDGVQRKRFFLENGIHQGRWVEGVGSLDWVFTYPTYSGSVSGGYIFICNSHDGQTVFANNVNKDCDAIVKTVEIENSSHFDIYPNPVRDIFNIDLKNLAVRNLTIVNLTGKIVFDQIIDQRQNVLQVSQKLESGIYFIKIFTETEKVITKKFIKI